jgi:antitoxin (DNA-binding transcriptional repressor) of toxin-antitoxin stability system
MVLLTDPAGTGEGRLAKCRRTFADVLARVRGGNRSTVGFTEHGRMVYQAICAERERQAELELQRQQEIMRQQEAELIRRLDEAEDVEGISPEARGVLDRFSAHLGREMYKLALPPGPAGELVQATSAASRIPYDLYSIPATLAVLGGLVARAYVPDVGGPLNMNYVLMAGTSSGKTQTMKAWEKFMAQAQGYLPMNVQPLPRILEEGTSSIQGIWRELERVPSCVWFIEEAAKQLNAMTNPKTGTDENLIAFYNQLYDAGEHGKEIRPPRSAQNEKQDFKPIRKLCVSTFWSTTPSMFEITDRSVTNGLVSRVVFIRYTGPGGEPSRHQREHLPEHLARLLADLLAQAHGADVAYRQNSAAGATPAALGQRPVDTRQVADLAWEVTCVCSAITRDGNSRRLPEAYTAFGRVPQSAMRLACTLAILQNPWAPVVTPLHYKWSLGYLLQNMASLLSSMDKGEIGDNASDEIRAVQRVMTALVRKGLARGKPGLARNDVHNALRDLAMFKGHKDGRGAGASRALKNAVEEGYVEELQLTAGTKGRPTTYLRLCPKDAA